MGYRAHLAAGLIAAATLLAACQTTAPDGSAEENRRYSTEIRWTSYGIPHVKAGDWASLGYGYAYATATDAICVIARDVVRVNGSMSEHFGASEDDAHLSSDVFHRAILTQGKLDAFNQALSAKARAFNRGYVAGYNRYLRDHAETLPESCAQAPWVRPIVEDDLTRMSLGVGIRYGLARFSKQIAGAAPEPSAAPQAAIPWALPPGIGSNAIAVGSELSATGRGMLLGNPHYPWHGPSRFHLIHTTIPGELDVMGASLLNTTRVSIGFNADLAWTHTVSTALRFTLYRLDLVEDDPLRYRFGDEERAITRRTVSVPLADGESVERAVYFSHFGPMIEGEGFAWGDGHAYTLRDAVIDNYQTAETYDAISRARTVAELEAAISRQGVYWTNTIAADREGNAFYADISGTPNIDQALLEACRLPATGSRLVLLRGNDPACEWRNDPRSRVPGALPPELMPRLTTGRYVTNSNDSYWLSTPEAPLEGYSPVIGPERTARTLRTRAGLVQMSELLDRGEPLRPDDLQALLYSHRNYGAELLLDEVLDVCDADGGATLTPVCAVLRGWDRTGTVDSVGSHVWREFWDSARTIPDLYREPFDPERPVTTPAGINGEDPAVRRAVVAALTNAQDTLATAGIALDAPLGEIQYAQRGDERIAIPGGEGWAGMFSMIRSQLQPQRGYTPIVHGNSYIQMVSWDEAGALDARGMLAYSQSPEPQSPHYSNLTKLYSEGGWIDLPFTDAQIDADPNLTTLRLVE
ncbi:MAG: penicillin acylase family protein [Pseudomonadota bacterium]